MALIFEKWNPTNPNCAFKHYFYNKVDEAAVPFYKPGPHEDPKEWEEALQKKPAPGFIPVLCTGFGGVAARLQLQKKVVGELNVRLHQINASLDAILSRHDLETSVRALAARRRHVVLRERCLALAARVQVLRNRGYAMSGDEDDLRLKLAELERSVQDPALAAREEELWSRLIVLRDYADQLMKEANKPAFASGEGLSEETEHKTKKVSFWLSRVFESTDTDCGGRSWRTTRSRSSTSKRRSSRSRKTLRIGRRSGIRAEGSGGF